MAQAMTDSSDTIATSPNAEAGRVTLTAPVSEGDHVQGIATAAITLVEYGDYEDPQCAAVQPWIRALQAQMGDRLRLVVRHFPTHRLPPHAAEAAEAAGLQGRFWGMHDTLYEHQSALGNGFLVEYARDLGLDTSRFLRDMTGHTLAERVRLDQAGGAQSGVRSAPTFFVNGVLHPSPHYPWQGAASWAAVVGACDG